VFLQEVGDLGSLFDLFLLDVDHLLVVLVAVFLLLVVHHLEGLVHLHLLQLLLDRLQRLQEWLRKELTVLHLTSKDTHVLEVLERLALVHGVELLSSIDPTELLVNLRVELTF
jgi:hypothetical protein